MWGNAFPFRCFRDSVVIDFKFDMEQRHDRAEIRCVLIVCLAGHNLGEHRQRPRHESWSTAAADNLAHRVRGCSRQETSRSACLVVSKNMG